MKVITGKMFNTSFGKIIVHNEQTEKLFVGESVVYNGDTLQIKNIIPPTKPDGKWSLSV